MAALEVPPQSIDQHQHQQYYLRSLSEPYLSPEPEYDYHHHSDFLSAQLLANFCDQLQTNPIHSHSHHHHHLLHSSRSGSYLDQLLQHFHHFSVEDLAKSFETKNLNEQEVAATAAGTTTTTTVNSGNNGGNSKRHDGTYDGGTSSTSLEYGTTSSGGGTAERSNSIGNRSNRSTKSDSTTTTTTTTIRDWQKKLYDFLNYPNNLSAILYQIALLLLFIIYIMLLIFTDRTTRAGKCKLNLIEPDFIDDLVLILKNMLENFLVLYFVFEYCARLFASRSHSCYEKLSAWKWIVRYHFRVSHLFDLILACACIVVSSCFITLPLDCTQDVYALIVLRGLHRLFNVAQWSSIHARHSPWSLMVEVFQEQGHMLFGIFYMELLLVLGMAYAVFLAEKHTAEKPSEVPINDMFEALYWSSITLITVGYGDKAPVTILGRVITSLGIMISMGLFALPSGIIATSLAIKLNEQDEIRSRPERRVLAATLIQRVWRFKRRQKRFELASWILNSSRYKLNPPPQPQPQQSTRENPTNEQQQQSSSTTPKVPVIVYVVEPLNIRIDGQLFEKIEQLYAKRYEFYWAQFLELCQIQVARRKFAQLLKRHNQPFADSRRLIKAHWLEHRQLTELLEVMHHRLDQCYQTFEQQQQQLPSSSGPTLEQIECQLTLLHQRLVEQRQSLAEMIQLNFGHT